MMIQRAKRHRFHFLVFIFSFLSGCQQTKPVPKTFPISVEVEKIEPKTIPAVSEYIGIVQSSHEIEIRARITGYLDTIGYVEGAFVKEGDLLFQIDPRPYEAALAKAQAQLAREQALLWQNKRAVQRFMPLYQQKAASQRDLDDAMASEMSAHAQVMEAQAQVTDAEINLSYTTILSPVSGLTSAAQYRVGALISPLQDKMTTVSVVDPIWVNFSISEQDILDSQSQIRQGRLIFPPHEQFGVELILGDQTLFPEKGIVNFASPSYSQTTGTLMVRAVLPNPHQILRPRQFVRVKIHGATWPNAIAIPQSAVQRNQKGSFVFIVNANNEAEVRLIDPGPWTENEWIIWEGLTPGDQVIVSGVNKVLPGSPVNVMKERSIPEKERRGRSTP